MRANAHAAAADRLGEEVSFLSTLNATLKGDEPGWQDRAKAEESKLETARAALTADLPALQTRVASLMECLDPGSGRTDGAALAESIVEDIRRLADTG